MLNFPKNKIVYSIMVLLTAMNLIGQHTKSFDLFGGERSLFNQKQIKLAATYNIKQNPSDTNEILVAQYNLLDSYHYDSTRKYGNADDYMFIDAFSKGMTIIIPQKTEKSEPYIITSKLEIPPGRLLKFETGAIIDITDGGLLKGNYTFIEAGLHQIFTITSSLTEDRLDWAVSIKAFPEWFGAIPDSKTDCRPAIQKTLDVFHQNIWLTGYDYLVVGTLVLDRYNSIKIGPLTYISPAMKSKGDLFKITKEPFSIEGGVILIPWGFNNWIFNVAIDREGNNDRNPRFMSGIRNMIIKGQDHIGVRNFSGMAYKGLKVTSAKEDDFTYFSIFENVDFFRPDTAIYLSGHSEAGMSNSWQFNNITIDWPMRGIVLTETAAGHVFSNLVIQPNTMYPGVMIDVASQYNTFNGMIWDIHCDSTIVLRKTAGNNWFANMGKVDLYESYVTDYTPYKVQNTFSTASPFEPTSNGRYHYYTMENIGIGIDNNKFSGAPRLFVASNSFPVVGVKRNTQKTGGSLDGLKGIAGGTASITQTRGNMKNGFGGGLVFLVKDISTDSTTFSENVMARVYARRDGADNRGLLQFFTKGKNAGLPSLTIRNSGFVGIGITAPSSELEVKGTTTINNILKIKPRSSAPSSPDEGTIYINSTDHNIYCYLNGAWVQLNK